MGALTNLLTIKADRNRLTSAHFQEVIVRPPQAHTCTTLSSLISHQLPYLQSASFSSNSITSTQGISHPMLGTLNLSGELVQILPPTRASCFQQIGNKITQLEGLNQQNLPSLQFLDLHDNQLPSSAGIHLPSLEKLYLASNKLTRVEGLEGLCKMTTLHLRQNQIATLDGFAPTMESLQYINLRYL